MGGHSFSCSANDLKARIVIPSKRERSLQSERAARDLLFDALSEKQALRSRFLAMTRARSLSMTFS